MNALRTKQNKHNVATKHTSRKNNVKNARPKAKCSKRSTRTSAPPTTPPRLTQGGNAERFVARYGEDLRYCEAWGKWLVWDGKHWKPDTHGEMIQRAIKTVKSICDDAFRADEDTRTRLLKHAARSDRHSEYEGMIRTASSYLSVSPDSFDDDPFLFNCQNGVVDLRTGTLLEHDSKRMLSKISPVKCLKNAKCPTWTGFLDKILAGNRHLISYLQRVIGYSLTGDVTEKALFILCGDGDNGKTTLLEAIRYIMGDYAGTLEINSLMHKATTSEQQQTIARLLGRRFATASESEEGQRLNEAKIKQLTGMGKLTGRRLYEDAFDFDPQFKLFIDANHKPVVREQAIWNRIHLVPFTVSIPKPQQDKHLLPKLRAEGAGILAWAVQGCLEWQKHGLTPPQTVTDAVKEYREEMDVVREFIEDRCDVDAFAEVPFSELYDAYEEWSGNRREHPITRKAFGQKLDEKGFQGSRTTSARKRRGLRLNAMMSPDPPHSDWNNIDLHNVVV